MRIITKPGNNKICLKFKNNIFKIIFFQTASLLNLIPLNINNKEKKVININNGVHMTTICLIGYLLPLILVSKTRWSNACTVLKSGEN
ncbi:uncharacterized protein DS421_19g660380 [Arachis hypogaea]|uniref:Uncharacterized protein n=1 Tax=Arachis hypogaea TaxID=3818 RepID=A0A6B9VC86_ARAHY|nr:uncharacterized protein DS421_19g660380 [Arachis hypogaea]